jgi:hypothetical protein
MIREDKAQCGWKQAIGYEVRQEQEDRTEPIRTGCYMQAKVSKFSDLKKKIKRFL